MVCLSQLSILHLCEEHRGVLLVVGDQVKHGVVKRLGLEKIFAVSWQLSADGRFGRDILGELRDRTRRNTHTLLVCTSPESLRARRNQQPSSSSFVAQKTRESKSRVCVRARGLWLCADVTVCVLYVLYVYERDELKTEVLYGCVCVCGECMCYCVGMWWVWTS